MGVLSPLNLKNILVISGENGKPANLVVDGDITANGNVNASTNILWQTNIVWATNAYFAGVATNTPDGNPIPWLAGTNAWTGTNTFTNTVNLTGPVAVHGSTGGTSNVVIGGMTFYFVNGFFIKATTP